MAQQVTKFQSNAGGLFDSMYDAAKHDLHVYLGKSIDNEAITKKLIDHISADMPGFYHIVKDMEDARTSDKLDRAVAPPDIEPVYTMDEVRALGWRA